MEEFFWYRLEGVTLTALINNLIYDSIAIYNKEVIIENEIELVFQRVLRVEMYRRCYAGKKLVGDFD